MVKAIFFYILSFIFCINFTHSDSSKKIYIYNWSDFISNNSINQFYKKTNIEIVYDVFDSEEMLDAKLISGNTGYDLVFPSNGYFLTNQINMKLYQPINKKNLQNYKNINPKILQLLAESDPGNKYSIPYMWTITGLGYNADMLEKIDSDAPINSLDLIFNPHYAEKFSKCGIAWFSSPSEIISLAILYNGYNPNDINDKTLKIAQNTLQKVRKYIKYFSNDKYSDDLANGSVCIALGWVGDIARSKEKIEISDDSKVNVKYSLPKEGFLLSIDAMAIPRTSLHADDSHKFIDFLLNAKTSAENSQYTKHMPANAKAIHFLSQSLIDDPVLNPSSQAMAKAYISKVHNLSIIRKRNRIWNDILTATE